MRLPRYSRAATLAFMCLGLSAVMMFSYSSERKIAEEQCRDLGLPILKIETDSGKAIKRKDKYLKAGYSIEGSGANFSGRCKIRGHGNSTWKTPLTQKKPYLLKLNDAAPLLGMAPARKWVLLANACDRSMLRNFYAEHLARSVFDRMRWAPSSKFVTLFVNGKYMGLYSLSEKIEISPERLALGGGSFIAEIDSHERDFKFTVDSGVTFAIREPKSTQEEYESFAGIMRGLDEILHSPGRRDEFLERFDIDSFIDWYLLAEYSKNYDSTFYNSCYMAYDSAEGKLSMGPPWDYDIAFGNSSKSSRNGSGAGLSDSAWLRLFSFPLEENNTAPKDAEGFLINRHGWYKELFRNEEFARLAKSRWAEKSDAVQESIAWIEEQGRILEKAAALNDSVWHLIGSEIWPRAPGYKARKTYKSEVDFFAGWCKKRADWMDRAMAE